MTAVGRPSGFRNAKSASPVFVTDVRPLIRSNASAGRRFAGFNAAVIASPVHDRLLMIAFDWRPPTREYTPRRARDDAPMTASMSTLSNTSCLAVAPSSCVRSRTMRLAASSYAMFTCRSFFMLRTAVSAVFVE